VVTDTTVISLLRDAIDTTVVSLIFHTVDTTVVYRPHDRYGTWKFVCFFLLCTQKTQPLFLIYPHKKPSFSDKVWTYYRILISKRVKSRQTGKIGPLTPPQKFLSLLRYNLFVGVNEMRVKNITITVSVRVSVTIRVSLVWFVSNNSFGGVGCHHLPAIVVSPVSDAIDTTFVSLIFRPSCIIHRWTIDTTVVSIVHLLSK